MTRRELVKAAIHHQETDRVPYSISLCGDTWEKLLAFLPKEAQGNVLDNDIEGVGIPWWDWHELADDWKKPATPRSLEKVMGNGNYGGLVDRIKEQRQKSDKYLLVFMYGSHFEKAYFARGFENMMADFAANPAWTKKFLSRIVDRNMTMLENVMTIDEIDGILLGSDWGSQIDLLMSPAVWEDMIRPGEQREYDLIHSFGKDVWVHSCGKIDKVIPSLVEMGLDVLNPVQPECMDIAKLKADFGGKLAFWGGISTQRVLPFGTPDEVRAEARRVRDMISKGGGYVFAPAQGIQGDVPPENIIALLEVARESRKGA